MVGGVVSTQLRWVVQVMWVSYPTIKVPKVLQLVPETEASGWDEMKTLENPCWISSLYLNLGNTYYGSAFLSSQTV